MPNLLTQEAMEDLLSIRNDTSCILCFFSASANVTSTIHTNRTKFSGLILNVNVVFYSYTKYNITENVYIP